MKIAALLILMFANSNQKTVVVWDGTCLVEFIRTPRTRLVAPTDKDGKPIMAQIKLEGLDVVYKPGCYHYEVKK